jgi:hypothetical protein
MRPIMGKSTSSELTYVENEEDEIEDLYDLVNEAKLRF